MRKIALGIVMTCAAMGASAQVMFGGGDCGQWVKSPKQPDKAWALGYISGLNGHYMISNNLPQSKDPLDKLSSADQIWLWLDNYCKENPLRQTSTGLYILFEELKRK